MYIVFKLLFVELVRGLEGDVAGPSKMLPARGLVGFQEVVSDTKISTWVSLGVPMEILSHDAMFK